MPTLVADKLTPLSLDEAIQAFIGGARQYLGAEAPAVCVAVLVAQSALETGHWHAMHCNCFGNVKVPSDWPGLYCMFRCNEQINGKYVWFDPPHPATWFVAFETAAEGAEYQVEFLASRDRYANAWHWIYTGDPTRAVESLHQADYFTADEAPYARAVVSIFNTILPACRLACADGYGVPLTDSDRDHVAQLVAVTLWDAALNRARVDGAEGVGGVA